MQNELKMLQIKIGNHSQLIAMKERKADLQVELLWAKVRDLEKELEEKETQLKIEEAKISEVENERGEKGELLEQLRETNRYNKFLYFVYLLFSFLVF